MKCRTQCGCVDWNHWHKRCRWQRARRTQCGCVDWNLDCACRIIMSSMSHPVRVRGLKPCGFSALQVLYESHPVRVRGLKLFCRQWTVPIILVAPSAGAWIETLLCYTVGKIILVAPSAGAWIETIIDRESAIIGFGRTQCGCVDWNYDMKYVKPRSLCRTQWGCVDWNCSNWIIVSNLSSVAPSAGAWIETILTLYIVPGYDCRTQCGCVDWNKKCWQYLYRKL